MLLIVRLPVVPCQTKTRANFEQIIDILILEMLEIFRKFSFDL